MSFAFSPPHSLSRDEPWPSSSSMLLVHLYGRFTPICPCSPQPQSISGFARAFAFVPLPLLPVPPWSPSPHQSSLLPLEPFDLLYFLGHLFCQPSTHQLLFHDTTFLLHLVLSCLFPCQLCFLLNAMAHISSYGMSLLASWSLCVVVASCVQTFPRSSGTGPSSAITSLMMTSNFSMIFVELSRSRQELPCEVLRHHFPHHKCLLRFSNRFDLMLVLNHFQ